MKVLYRRQRRGQVEPEDWVGSGMDIEFRPRERICEHWIQVLAPFEVRGRALRHSDTC